MRTIKPCEASSVGSRRQRAAGQIDPPVTESDLHQLDATVIGEHPESFPDTHGSPILGMGFAALAAHAQSSSFSALMNANRWWFTLAQCADGTFYYQPNRDNAGYGADSRLSASAVTAFILSLEKKSLHLAGKRFE